jgi:peptidoglycan/LPS O-acetylase OafA/YrhL
MFWQFQGDFLSLFTRGNDKKSYLDPIDGLRSIANLSIILLHLVIMFSAFVSPYPNIEWQQFLTTKAFASMNILAFNLEIFFMLSAFLSTYRLINQWNQNPTNFKSFLRKEESCHKCPLENVLDKMSPSFGPPKKCPLDLVL